MQACVSKGRGPLQKAEPQAAAAAAVALGAFFAKGSGVKFIPTILRGGGVKWVGVQCIERPGERDTLVPQNAPPGNMGGGGSSK